MKINIECGKRLKECRMAAGLSQKEFAELVNYSAQQICYIENGKRALSEEAATNFAKKLGRIRPEYLLCKDNIPFEDDKKDMSFSIFFKESLMKLLLRYVNYELYEFIDTEKESSEKNSAVSFLNLRNKSVLRTPNNDFYSCQDDIMEELAEDVINYATMRIEKWLLSKCEKATPEEMNEANLTIDGTFKSMPRRDMFLERLSAIELHRHCDAMIQWQKEHATHENDE